MRIVLLTFAFPPESIGGTEIYVESLARELQRAGEDVSIVIPSSEPRHFVRDDGLRIWNLPAASFGRWLAEWNADVVHAHPLTSTWAVPFLAEARDRAGAIVCTYHTPTISCGRGDLMRHGRSVCDGKVDERLCVECVLQSKGVPRALCRPVRWLSSSQVPTASIKAGRAAAMMSVKGRQLHGTQAWAGMTRLVDHWIAPSQWVAALLSANGVLADRITLSRQGQAAGCEGQQRLPERAAGAGPLVVGFLGRIHRFKGLDVLLEAVSLVPSNRVKVRIAGGGDVDYVERLRRASSDPRIEWLGAIPPSQVPEFLSGIDVLVVPSVWMETGPMTVLEAWAAGVPVIGSARGGVSEWIEESGGGILFPPGDRAALARILEQVMLGEISLPCPPKNVRCMADVSTEMMSVYRSVAPKCR